MFNLYISLQIWKSIEDQGIKEDIELKQMVCYDVS